jgi:uncharacterized repeat protein (TIGR03803 family)
MKSFKVLPLVMMVMVMCLTVSSVRGGILFTTLVSFTGTNGPYPGANPSAGLVLGADGNFYGTTVQGGSNNLGTIFQLTPDGVFTSIISFDGTNGANPHAALVKAGDDNFYGTTFAGGVSNLGTIFLITTNAAFTNLFSFTGAGNPSQGANPGAALVQAGAGSFYGTAAYGGLPNASYRGHGYGTIFCLATDGTVTAPVVFGNTNGAHPTGGLTLGADGNFYGTTTYGGNGITGSFPGYGTIFKLTPDGTLTNLYLFTGFNDGGFPYASLVQGNDGNFYGSTTSGGTNQIGTVFSITPDGQFKSLYSFMSSSVGSYPIGGLVQASDGNLYGTTYIGGDNQLGTIFEITTNGNLTRLVSFTGTNGPSLGANPQDTLVQGTDGNFYGTTSLGGANGLGTIFRLSVPMPAVITAITVTDGAATLTWSAVAGQTYQVQYSDDLTGTNWLFMNKPSVATSGIMTATDFDGIASFAQRFYRVVLE